MEGKDPVTYRLKQISLEPDQYGRHLKIKMVTMYDGQGEYVKHVKLDENMLEILSESVVVPSHLVDEVKAHSIPGDESEEQE